MATQHVITSARLVTAERERRRATEYAASLSLLLLAYAGYFEANPFLSWVPVDLTVAGAVLTAGGITCVLLTRGQCTKGMLPVLSLWALFIPAAVIHAPDPYGASKSLHLFTLTLLAALGPVFLLRSRRGQRVWVILQIALGAILAIGAWLSPPRTLSAGEIIPAGADRVQPDRRGKGCRGGRDGVPGAGTRRAPQAVAAGDHGSAGRGAAVSVWITRARSGSGSPPW